MDKPLVTIKYKTADGKQICVEVSTAVKELLEQSDRQIRSQRRQDRRRHTEYILSPIEKWDGKHSAHVIGKNGKCVSTKSDNSELSAYVTNSVGIVDSATFITVHDRLSRNEKLGRGNGDSPIGELAGLLNSER